MPLQDKDGKPLTSQQVQSKVRGRLESILLETINYILLWTSFLPFSVFRLFFYRLAGMKIDISSTLNYGVRVYDSRHITIGSDTIIGEYSVLDGRGDLTIGDHVDIASEVMIYNSEHDINNPTFAAVTESVAIEDYAFIGPRAIILPGVTIGRGAVIGAGAIVTKSVPAGEVWGGVPAKKISERQVKELNYRLRRKGIFEVLG